MRSANKRKDWYINPWEASASARLAISKLNARILY
jgi:hypothetical protein